MSLNKQGIPKPCETSVIGSVGMREGHVTS